MCFDVKLGDMGHGDAIYWGFCGFTFFTDIVRNKTTFL